MVSLFQWLSLFLVFYKHHVSYDHDIVDDNFDGIDDKMIATLKVKMKDEPEVS